MASKYEVWSKATPGAMMSVVAGAASVRGARTKAAQFLSARGSGDLTYQDVRIIQGGRFVEYAGPAR